MEAILDKSVKSLDVQKIRADFPILRREMNGKPLVFLDSAASSQKPLQVVQAVQQYYNSGHANVHRGIYNLSQEATNAFELARKKVAKFINAEKDCEVIFTKGATEAINLVAHGFSRSKLKTGDEVLVTGMEHHSNIVPWQLACEYTGATLKVIPVLENGTLDMEAAKRLLTSNVKILALVHISNTLGTINPVRELIDMAHQQGIPVLIDGAQASPHYDIDVQDLDADFYVFSGHKMYAPTGIGILYGKENHLKNLPPYQGGGEMISNVSFEQTTYNDLPFKFEAGTPNISGAIGLGAAIDYLENTGFEGIRQHEQQLLQYATDALKAIPGLRIIGEAPQKAAVVSFLIEELHPYDIGTLLDKMGVAVRTGHHCTQPLMDLFEIPGTIRASFGLYNTEREIDILKTSVEKAISMLR